MKKLFLVLASLILASCSKNVTDEIPHTTQGYDFAKDIQLMEGAANPNNPYDNFGRQHFLGVINVMSRLDSYANVNDIIKLSSEFATSINEDVTSAEMVTKGRFVTQGRELTQAELQMIYNNAKNKYIFAVDGTPSPLLQSKINEFSKTIQLLDETPGDYSYTYVHSKIVNFENSILNDQKLIESDRALILKSTSTYRYSLAQWDKPLDLLVGVQGVNGVIQTPVIQYQKKKLKWFHWIIIGATDAAGALLGGGVGGAIAASTLAYNIIKGELAKTSNDITPVKPV